MLPVAAGVAALLEIPEHPDPPPVEDLSSSWGWGTGVELGLRLSVGGRWATHSTVFGFYQDIYEGSSSHFGWSWHLGLSYGHPDPTK